MEAIDPWTLESLVSKVYLASEFMYEGQTMGLTVLEWYKVLEHVGDNG